MKHARAITVAILLGVLGLPLAIAQKNEIRDFPPDFHQYIREALPEDIVPGGELALPPEILGMGGLANGILIKDVVISNTDKNLKNTNRASNSEPSIAINPTNPKEIDIFAFTAGWGSEAPIWHSTNGGNIWSLDSTIPNPTGLTESGCPCDQTPDYGRDNRLSATFLDLDHLGIDAYSGTTTDPTSAAAWKWFVKNGAAQPTDQVGQGGTDQPWLLVNQDPEEQSQDDVYVAYDNFDGAPDMRIAVAPGSDPPDFTIDNLAGFSQGEVNPGQRLAVDRNSGAIYTLFQQCPTSVSNCNNIAADPKTIHWFLNRSTDGGHTWTLNGSSTGIQVASGQSTQPQPKFGTVNALLGGVNHIAVDPNNSDVYVVFGNRDPNTTMNRLSIVRLTSDGKAASRSVSRTLSPARCRPRCLRWPLRKTAKEPSGSSTLCMTGSTRRLAFRLTPQSWRSVTTTASALRPISWRNFSRRPRTMATSGSACWVTTSSSRHWEAHSTECFPATAFPSAVLSPTSIPSFLKRR